MSLRIEANSEPIPGYRLIERIGGGGFGEVWKAEAPGGLLKAIKIIHGDLRSVDADGAKHAEQELRALKRLQGIRHPYLLSLERYDVIQGRVLIVSELADCNLWDRFREHRANARPGIPRSELLRYMHEAAEVLDLMNNQYQLQHLDIKPQNLFLLQTTSRCGLRLVKDLEGMRGQITGGYAGVRGPGRSTASSPGSVTSTASRSSTRSCSPGSARSTGRAGKSSSQHLRNRPTSARCRR